MKKTIMHKKLKKNKVFNNAIPYDDAEILVTMMKNPITSIISFIIYSTLIERIQNN